MNIKKIVSAIAALAIAVSSFAGLTVNAATADEGYSIKYDENFDSLDAVPAGFTHVISWTGSYHENALRTGGISAEDTTGKFYVNAWNNAGGNHQGAFTLMPLDEAEKAYGVAKVSFNMYLGSCNNNGIYNFASLVKDGGYTGATSGNQGYVTTDDILQLQYDNSKNLKLVYTDNAGVSQTQTIHTAEVASWETVTAEINCVTGELISLSCKNSGAEEATVVENVMLKNDFKGVGALVVGRVRTGGNVKVVNEVGIDDIVVQEKETFDVSVNVQDDSGAALEGVVVSVGSYSATSDAEGVAALKLPAGEYTFSTELTEIDGALYQEGTAELTVVDAAAEVDLVMNKKVAEPATVTVKFVDAANTTKELKNAEVVADDMFVGIEYVATDDQKADFTYTDADTGIIYTAKLNAESPVSVTPDAATAELVLKFDLTENTYEATITTAPYAQVVVTGTTASGAEFAGNTVNTNNAGSVVVSLKKGTYNVAVTKNGYVASETNALEVSTTNAAVTVELTTTDADVLYYEDFSTAGSYVTYDGDMRMTYDNNDMDMYNGGGGARTTSLPMNIQTDCFELSMDVAFAATNSHLLLRDSANQLLGAFVCDASGLVTFSAPGTNYNTGNKVYPNGGDRGVTLATVTTGEKVTVNVKVDNNAGVVVASIGDNEVVINDFAKADNRASYKNFTSIYYASDRYFTTTLDNIVVKEYAAPALTVATESVDVTVPTDAVTADLIAVDGEAVAEATTETVDLTDVTTVYIKVDNVEDETVMPAVVVGGETYAPTKAYTINSNNYFVYQFVGIDLTDAVVTYAGAADATL